jgi:4-oxalmesaconate hydratase
MIIDCHGHMAAPAGLYVYNNHLLNTRGMEGRGSPGISDEQLEAAAQNNLRIMDRVGTDVRLTSPRPYLMHSERPVKLIAWWVEAVNDTIHRFCKLHPDRLGGIGGLPQVSGEPVDAALDEIDRLAELGFAGVSVNPDPGEGDNATPTMGEEYWYPLYERCQALDMPILVHSASCRMHQRESYTEHFITEETIATLSLCKSTVFEDFPNLKIVMSHGGGSVPYQIGRHRSLSLRGGRDFFDDAMRKMWFDTVILSETGLNVLFREVGPDRCIFGTEKPGIGSSTDPKTGEDYDDVKPKIERLGWLTDEQKHAVFEGNARKVFTRMKLPD